MSDEKRRIDIPVGVAYGTDPKTVLDLLTRVGTQNADIMNDPAPRAIFSGFGESSLDFELRAWTAKADDWVPIRSDLVTAVYAALTEAGIEIPFPQRDLNLRAGSEVPVKLENGDGS
jgi:small-conductance mechanosensitive channel